MYTEDVVKISYFANKEHTLLSQLSYLLEPIQSLVLVLQLLFILACSVIKTGIHQIHMTQRQKTAMYFWNSYDTVRTVMLVQSVRPSALSLMMFSATQVHSDQSPVLFHSNQQE